MQVVKFTEMQYGTQEEYDFLDRRHKEWKSEHFVKGVLDMLKATGEPDGGYQINRFQHALQSATLALRDGQDEEMIVAALLHDIGDLLAPDNHSDLAAAVLQPYVSERVHWIIKHHGIFQGYYFWHFYGGNRNERERYRGHPWFEDCANFCAKYDQNAFDPNYDTLPLEAFEPMVHRILSREPFAFEKPQAAE